MKEQEIINFLREINESSRIRKESIISNLEKHQISITGEKGKTNKQKTSNNL